MKEAPLSEPERRLPGSCTGISSGPITKDTEIDSVTGEPGPVQLIPTSPRTSRAGAGLEAPRTPPAPRRPPPAADRRSIGRTRRRRPPAERSASGAVRQPSGQRPSPWERGARGPTRPRQPRRRRPGRWRSARAIRLRREGREEEDPRGREKAGNPGPRSLRGRRIVKITDSAPRIRIARRRPSGVTSAPAFAASRRARPVAM